MLATQKSRATLSNPIDLLYIKGNGYSSRILSQHFPLDYISRCYFFNEETNRKKINIPSIFSYI